MGHPRLQSTRRAVVGRHAGGRGRQGEREGEHQQEASEGGGQEVPGRGAASAVAIAKGREEDGGVRGRSDDRLPAIGPYRGSLISGILLLRLISTTTFSPLPSLPPSLPSLPACVQHQAAAMTTTYTRQDMCSPPASTIGFHNPGAIHSALMRGLEGGRDYTYRVGDAGG